MISDLQGGRIVVALDDSPHGRAALEAAAQLAARWDAELVGVFVEDLDLLRIAELPFAAGLTHYSDRPRVLTRADMERALKLQGARLRRELEAAAIRKRVRWQFRTVRGRVAAELLLAAEGAAMLVLGKASSARVRDVRIGANARLIVTKASRTVVLLQHGANIARPVLAVYDATAAGDRALAIAAAIAQADHGHLVVLVPAAEIDSMRRRAVSVLGDLAAHVRFVEAPETGIGELVRAARQEGCNTLVLSAESRLLGGASVADIARKTDCPVVVVR